MVKKHDLILSGGWEIIEWFLSISSMIVWIGMWIMGRRGKNRSREATIVQVRDVGD